MIWLILPAAGLLLLAFIAHGASVALAWRGCRRAAPARASWTPPVSLVRPLCGLEPFSEATLRASFHLEWPQYEILFCLADMHDPIAPLARRLMAEHPHRPARLLCDAERRFANPKLANMAQGWRAAQHDRIVFIDSNVLAPPDYLHRLFAAGDPGPNGVVSAPPAGVAPQGFWAEVECAFLNGWQARVQYAADALGFGFAQGKTLCFSRPLLDEGGFEALAGEAAEDAAATKLARSKGGAVRLAGPPFAQPVGRRSFAAVWARQTRWARLRRATFPALFAPEILAGSAPPLFGALALAHALDLSLPAAGAGVIIVWLAPELALTRAAGWPLSWRTPLAMIARDLLMPAIHVAAMLRRSIVWRGRVISAAPLRAPGPALQTNAWRRWRSALRGS